MTCESGPFANEGQSYCNSLEDSHFFSFQFKILLLLCTFAFWVKMIKNSK